MHYIYQGIVNYLATIDNFNKVGIDFKFLDQNS